MDDVNDAKVEATVQVLVDHLTGWGFPPEVQQRLGAFVLLWGILETSLEGAVWKLKREQINNRRPSTDRTSAGDWFNEFKPLAEALDARMIPITGLAVQAAVQVMNYRHAIAHGYLVPDEKAPTLYRNPGWNGELRKRPKGVARVTVEELDLAIDATWTLAVFIMHVRDVWSDQRWFDRFDTLMPGLYRAIAAGDRLDSLTQLMHRDDFLLRDPDLGGA